ncbi:MAG: SPOR domain-containing protein [Salinivirgaceae bacterium]|nr:SPOR domain-containing protein [Salinivirgaceae bacterium]
MKLKILYVVFACLSIGTTLFGQSKQEDSLNISEDIFLQLQAKSTGGKIEITQDPSLNVLVDKSIRMNEKEGLNGFRIQIYSGSDQNAREKLNQLIEEFQTSFPDFDASLIYTEYQAPYFKLRVGDYRNKNEAYEFFHQVRKKFPNSYIVKSKIKYPKLGYGTN